MNEEELKHHNEINKLFLENCFTGRIPYYEKRKIISDVQQKQRKILDRKYVDEEELKRKYVTI